MAFSTNDGNPFFFTLANRDSYSIVVGYSIYGKIAQVLVVDHYELRGDKNRNRFGAN